MTHGDGDGNEIGPALRVELQRARRAAEAAGVSEKALVEWSIDRVSFGVVDLERVVTALGPRMRRLMEMQERKHASEMYLLHRRMKKLETAFKPRKLSARQAAHKPKVLPAAPAFNKQLQPFAPFEGRGVSFGWMRDDVIAAEDDQGVPHVIAEVDGNTYVLTPEHDRWRTCFVCRHHEYTEEMFLAQMLALRAAQ